MKKLDKKNLERLLEEIGESRRVYVPVRERKKIQFKEFEGQEVEKDYLNTLIPVKKLLFPDKEKLLTYEETEEGIEIQENKSVEKQFVFGVRPCDFSAVLILDKIAAGEYEDKYYQEKRENTIFAVLECKEPGENCFCKYFGSGPGLDKKADLIFTDLGTKYLARAATEEGEGILENQLFEEANDSDLEKRDKLIEKARGEFEEIELDGGPVEVDEELLQQAAERCISCFSCTFLCPVCSCFDVVDRIDFFEKTGQRHRCWDSCMAKCFAEMAGGVNPREDKEKRLFNKIKDKLEYMPNRIQEYGCVGCGRCIDECPAGISIKYFIEK